MYRKQIFTTSLSVALAVLLSTSLVLAGPPEPPGKPGPAGGPLVDVGAPGLSFRYLDTLGETGVPYFIDGDHIYHPEGVGVDTAGNLWVAETVGGRSLKYATDGAFLMSIGAAGSLFVDENHFCEPSDIAVDGAGNIWVADRCSNRAVQYDPDGNYLSHLGVLWEGGTDNDHFAFPVGLALDSAGRIYVSDESNHRIQVFDGSGVYSTTLGVTGEPGPGNDHFHNPYRIAIDDSDNLYVADMVNNRVQIFDSSLTYSATLGITGECGGPSDNERLCAPRGVAVDAARIYVADTDNNRVQVFNRATLAYEATLGGAWGSGDYEFRWLTDVAVDSAGNLYVADAPNHRAQRYDGSLTYVRTVGTTGVPYLTDGNHYSMPQGLAVDPGGAIGLVEPEGHRFVLLDANGDPQFTIGEAGVPGSDNDHFARPQGLAFDAAGNIYVSDSLNSRIQIFDSSGTYQTTLGSGPGSGNYEFNNPMGLVVDRAGKLFVVDANNHRVQIFDSGLTYLATLGVTGEPGSDNAHFNSPRDVEVDSDGRIYVADGENHRVQIFDGDYLWQRTVGATGECGDRFDRLCLPTGVAVDGQGNLFVADMPNSRVQVFNPLGDYLTTVGGDHGNKTGSLTYPHALALDAQGTLVVADTANDRIQTHAPGVPGWRQANINGFGERSNDGVAALEGFGGYLYAGTSNPQAGGRVWRTADGSSWTPASEPGFSGTYTQTNRAVIDLFAYDGRLYAGTGWGDGPGQLWRSSDGTTWEPVSPDGFGDGENGAITSFGAFDGMLYVGTGNGGSNGAQIWRSSTGNSGSWTQVAPEEPGPGPSNVTGLVVYQGALYAAIEGEMPAQIWRSTNGADWTRVVTDGFGNPRNTTTGGFAAFGAYLYVGAGNAVDGAQVWRSADGLAWSLAAGDGLGDLDNDKVEMLFVFGSQLYAGLKNPQTGLEIWRSANGTAWTQVNVDGFGDSNNIATLWSSATAVYRSDLYVATWNTAHGGEVWQRVTFRQFLPVVRNSP